MKFVPAEFQDVQIAEFDPSEVLSQTVESTTPVIVHFSVDDDSYGVNMAAPRYAVLQKSRTCACCGIIGNRMFLEPYIDKETGGIFHRMNLYAETRNKPDSKTHLVMMTLDHIVPKKDGGSEDPSNHQTLCWLCNIYKDATGLSIEKVQNSLFTAYRIHRSSFAIRETRRALALQQQAVEKCERDVQNITLALEKARPTNRLGMLEKIEQKRQEGSRLRDDLERVLLESQIHGTVLNEVHCKD